MPKLRVQAPLAGPRLFPQMGVCWRPWQASVGGSASGGLRYPASEDGEESADHGRGHERSLDRGAKVVPDELRERAVRLYRTSIPRLRLRDLAEQSWGPLRGVAPAAQGEGRT